MDRLKRCWPLLRQFILFGCFTFGGGWSIVAQMKKTYVDQQHVLTDQDLLDLTSVGRSLPGTMISNTAMLFGYRQAGFLGGLCCVFGMITAPFIVLAGVTYCYTALQGDPWMAAAMTGVRAAVVPIMVSALLGLYKSAYRFPPCVAVTALCFSLYLFFGFSCVWLVVIGAVLGLVMCEYYERKEADTHGAA